MVMLIIFSGCASIPQNTDNRVYITNRESTSQNDDYRVYIADIESVKLYPNETLQKNYLEKSLIKRPPGQGAEWTLEEITISNGCGKAEIQYKTIMNLHITVWMEMGEWCDNPFDYSLDSQLIVVDPNNNQLLEYYPIEETRTMGEVILPLENPQLMYSIFRDFVKPLTEPIFWGASKADDGWIEMMIGKGLIEEIDNEIWIIKGVYLSDVIKCYKLENQP
jgi:hypothetical protein